MASHIVEQILAQVQTILLAQVGGSYQTDAKANVFRNRTTAIPEGTTFPVINQLQGPVRPLASKDGFLNVRYIDSELEIYLELSVASIDPNGQATETELNNLWSQCHKLIFANSSVNLGLPFVQMAFPSGADEPVVHSESDQQYVTMKTSWSVRFRTNISDPTQVS